MFYIRKYSILQNSQLVYVYYKALGVDFFSFVRNVYS